MASRPKRASAAFLLLCGIASLHTSEAANSTWTSNATGTPSWFTPANWSAGFPGVVGDSATNLNLATFGTGTSTSIGINQDLSLGTISITSGSRAFTNPDFSLQTLRLNGSTVAGNNNVILSNSGGGTLTLDGGFFGAQLSLALGSSVDNLILLTNGSTAIISSNIANANGVQDGRLTLSGNGTLTLSGSFNSYTGGTTLSGGTLIAGRNSALGTGTISFNGGALASDNDSRSLSNAITVTSVGGSITGSNNLTLTGNASGTGRLTINMGSNADTLTLNPGTNNGFNSGSLSLTKGTLLLGAGGNKIGDSTSLILNGGILNTAGLSEVAGTLTLSSSSTIDLGAGNSTLTFSSLAGYTGGTLTILGWTGNAFTGGTNDHIYFTSNVTNSSFLANVVFDGFNGNAPGATIVQQGVGGPFQLVPIPEPATILGGVLLTAIAGWLERRRIQRAFGKSLSLPQRNVA